MECSYSQQHREDFFSFWGAYQVFFSEHPSPEKNHYTTPFLFMTKDQVLERARNSSSSLSNAAPCYVVFCGKIAVCRRRSFLFFKWAFSFYYCGTQSFRNFYLFFRKPSSFSSLELKLRKSDFRARRRSRKRKEWEEMRFMHIRFFFSFYTFFPTWQDCWSLYWLRGSSSTVALPSENLERAVGIELEWLVWWHGTSLETSTLFEKYETESKTNTA